MSWSEDLQVSWVELEAAVKQISGRSKAPGPDGITGPMWGLASGNEAYANVMRQTYTACLRNAVFPARWKTARLVLLPKPGKAPGGPSSYRPLCMLDEAGKLLERIIVGRMHQHLATAGNLSPSQFGFRKALSTVEAISELRCRTKLIAKDGHYAVAVALDIANAFGSVPWTEISRTMRRRKFPDYICNIVDDYLDNRKICFARSDGHIESRAMTCGVPQGSVLGPLLWNIVYDEVLNTPLSEGCSVICYADDTLVIVRGSTPRAVAAMAEINTERIIAAIQGLGLKVAAQKTEAMVFFPGKIKGRAEWPDGLSIRIGDADVVVKDNMKYLGMMIDSLWKFGHHVKYVAAKADKVASALGKLMPNVRGPNTAVRRLYATVVHSVMLYAVPVWSGVFDTHERNWHVLCQVQRRVCIRVIAGYANSSHKAAGLLAGFPPMDILARGYTSSYNWKRSFLAGTWNECWPITERKTKMQEQIVQQWEQRVAIWGNEPGASHRCVRLMKAFEGKIERFWHRTHGKLSHWLTQLFTGHGAFADHQVMIGKARSPMCLECGLAEDTAAHALETCPRWSKLREPLKQFFGDDLRLRAVLETILDRKEAWSVLSEFAYNTMYAKLAYEKMRETLSAGRAISQ